MTLLSKVEENLVSNTDLVVGRRGEWSVVKSSWLLQVIHLMVSPKQAIRDIDKLNRFLHDSGPPGSHEVEEFKKVRYQLRLGRVRYYEKPKEAGDPIAISILDLAERHNGGVYVIGKANSPHDGVIRVRGCERDVYVNFFPNEEIMQELVNSGFLERYITYNRFKEIKVQNGDV
ncbi:MAG: hypothetical protein ABIE22_04460 [archaeon]